jgi:RNA processing factor Prp31
MKQELIIKKNISQSEKDLKDAFLKDELIIFFTRVFEDLSAGEKEIYGRLKELFSVLFPYEDISREFIYSKIESGEVSSGEGLELDSEEKGLVVNFCSGVSDKLVVRNVASSLKVAKKSLVVVNKKYLMNSSLLIEPFLLGKFISFFGGIENLYKRSASTIQLMGAEKAFFRFKEKEARGGKCPKYGLIYLSENVQRAKNDRARGKKARQLANRLSLAIKQDYFQKFYR